MRQTYEPGLDYDLDTSPITMWIAEDLYPVVSAAFKQNYVLPLTTYRTVEENGVFVYVVKLPADVNARIFLEHLDCAYPGAYRDELNRKK